MEEADAFDESNPDIRYSTKDDNANTESKDNQGEGKSDKGEKDSFFPKGEIPARDIQY